MINEGIERYDAKIDRRFSDQKIAINDVGAKLDRNVHETRNFRETVNNQFFGVKSQVSAVKDEVRENVAEQIKPVADKLDGISKQVSSTGGVSEFKRWILPTIIAAAVLLLKVLDYVHK